MRYPAEHERYEVTKFVREKKIQTSCNTVVIPKSNDGMNNVLTQIIGEKLGYLEDVAKITERRRPLSIFIALIIRNFSMNVLMSIC